MPNAQGTASARYCCPPLLPAAVVRRQPSSVDRDAVAMRAANLASKPLCFLKHRRARTLTDDHAAQGLRVKLHWGHSLLHSRAHSRLYRRIILHALSANCACEVLLTIAKGGGSVHCLVLQKRVSVKRATTRAVRKASARKDG